MPRRARTIAKKDRLSASIEQLAAQPLFTELTLTAITVLFGMQVLRVLVPSMFWVLGDRMGWSAIELGILGFLVFLTGFLAGPLGQLLGNRRLIAATAAGLGLMRLCMQAWWGEPLFNLSLAIIGTILFVIFLPVCFEDARSKGKPAISRYILGLLGGLALDVAINGTYNTYDTAWQVEPLPLLLTLLLLIIQMMLIVAFTSTIKTTSAKPRTTKTNRISMARSFTWLAIGPFLFLELVVFQNIPRLAVLTGWQLPIAFGLTLLAQLAGLAVAAWLLSKSWRMLWPWALAAGIILTAVLAFGYQKPATLIALMFILGQVLASALIAIVLIGITTSTGKTQRSGVWLANGVGMILLLLLIFAYYAVYDISLPYNNAILEPIAGGIIAACAIGASVLWQQKTEVSPKVWLVPALALILLILPLAQAITWRTPTAVTGQGLPVRVMTYNVHNGFNTNGKLNIEEIARVIENSNPDIVALQEVSRGWLVSGRLDMLTWLSQRLNMPYVFGPTADPFWGNAILSRYPILAYSKEDLPPRNLAIKRGFITALIDLGSDQIDLGDGYISPGNNRQIKVIDTHFHHLEGDTDIRQLQSQAILDFINNIENNHIVLLGDLNAEPTDPEILMLYQPQLRDVVTRINPTQAYTFASNNLQRRIDYIWISYDLNNRVGDIQVPFSTASDHLPIVVVINE